MKGVDQVVTIKLGQNQNIDISNPKISLKLKIFIGLLLVIIIGLLITIIILAVKKVGKNDTNESTSNLQKTYELENKNEEQILMKSGKIEPWYDVYGNKTDYIKYSKNGKIENSFKINGINYEEAIGNVNDGEDYNENERNIYSLYIPYSAKLRNNQNKYNGIILFIHGKEWIDGDKNDTEYLAVRYAKYGYITANMEYTILSENYTHYNIFRILDEITSCVINIKEFLLNIGFKENNLEFAIAGVSSGAHIALLYAHKMKNHIFDIKFLINIVGPVSLLPEYWYAPSEPSNVLDNIEEKDSINNAINEGKLKKIFDNEFDLLNFMNMFLGKKYNDVEIKEMIENNRINKENERFKEMVKIVENAFPINFIDGRYPILCQYCGNDQKIGIAHYSYIKEKYTINNKLDFLEFIYMKYGGNELYLDDKQQSIEEMQEMHCKILNFAKTYFTCD